MAEAREFLVQRTLQFNRGQIDLHVLPKRRFPCVPRYMYLGGFVRQRFREYVPCRIGVPVHVWLSTIRASPFPYRKVFDLWILIAANVAGLAGRVERRHFQHFRSVQFCFVRQLTKELAP